MLVSSVKVAGGGVISRLTGLARDMVIGNHFGATGLLDGYFVAASIPTLLQSAVGTPLQNSFISIYSRLRGRGDDRAEPVASLILLMAAIAAALVSVLTLVLSDLLVRLVAPGLDDSTMRASALMVRILAPLVVFGIVERWSASVLNSNGFFTTPAVIGIPRNIIIVLAVLLTAASYHVWGLVWGTLLAFAAGSAWLASVAIRVTGLRQPSLSTDRKHVGALGRLAWPAVVADLARRSGPVVDQILGSGLAEGTISALSFALRLAQVPVGLIGGAVATVLYPALARRAGSVEGPGLPYPVASALQGMILDGLTGSFVILAPAAAALVCLRTPVVNLIYGHGSFSPEAVAATATALAFYSLAIVPWAHQPVLSRAFYALGDSLTPMKVALVSVSIKVVVSWSATPLLGLGGIALGTGVGTASHVVILSTLLSRRLSVGLGRRFIESAWRVVIATGLAMVVGHLASGLASAFTPPGHLQHLVEVVMFTASSGVTYLALLFALRVPEARRVKGALMNWLRRRLD